MSEKITPVLIVGAGPAGLSAARVAARMGVQVLLVEKNLCVGGLMRSAFPDAMAGLASCAGQTALKQKAVSAFNREMLTRESLTQWMQDCLRDEKIDLLTGCTVYSVKMKNGQIRRVDAATPRGKVEIYPQIVIDATGQGYVAKKAGVQYLPGDSRDGLCEPPVIRAALKGADLRAFLREGRGYTVLEDPVFCGVQAEASFYGEVKVTLYSTQKGSADRTIEEETALHKHFDRDLERGVNLIRDHIAGMSNATLAYASDGYLFPEGVHPVGCHVLEEEEIRQGKSFADWAVGRILPENAGESASCAAIPYGSLVTHEVKNLLLCGNSISMSHDAAKSLFGLPAAMATGQAAGSAAVLALLQQSRVTKVDPAILQQSLLRLGMASPVETSENK